MIPVAEALARVLDLIRPVDTETVPLRQASGRMLRTAARATRAQPPFAASSMDGYAVAEPPRPGQSLQVVGEAAAGHAFDGRVAPGEAVRIFTGAPVPEGAIAVVLQEDVTRTGDRITLGEGVRDETNIRPAGGDFGAGFTLDPTRLLRTVDLALLAAMNVAEVTVSRRPSVALIATGDELIVPGEVPRPDQIVASNIYALAAMIEAAGGVARILPIARDNQDALRAVLDLAKGADLVVTIGGASVGDHDLVAQVAGTMGLERSFYKIAMRPGKPLMAGRIFGVPMLGLPGNPVSAIVCGHLFVLPALRALTGDPAPEPKLSEGRLAVDVGQNGPRAHYMRASLDGGGITPFPEQDSSLLTVLARADVLLLRPPHDGPQSAGSVAQYLAL
ncbi:molybdopterin molybdotransferase MoeA [Halodurantibacterium flavum]|uniref:Molybdopterin molybdenumtransferase n=1 Tax=Halodurantibacterium flavum TaxID=1382802 RepID=A0ABW4S4H4_9RHOB